MVTPQGPVDLKTELRIRRVRRFTRFARLCCVSHGDQSQLVSYSLSIAGRSRAVTTSSPAEIGHVNVGQWHTLSLTTIGYFKNSVHRRQMMSRLMARSWELLNYHYHHHHQKGYGVSSARSYSLLNACPIYV